MKSQNSHFKTSVQLDLHLKSAVFDREHRSRGPRNYFLLGGLFPLLGGLFHTLANYVIKVAYFHMHLLAIPCNSLLLCNDVQFFSFPTVILCQLDP